MKNFLRISLAAAGAIVLSFVITASTNPDFKIAKNMEIFLNIFREVNMLYVDEVDPDSLLINAADGMLEKLDPYTEYLPASEMKNFEVMTTGKYGGIGSLIKKDKNEEYVQIARPYKGKPADLANLKIDDKIIAINGKEMKNASTEMVSDMMKGEPGTILKMTIESQATGERREVGIKREIISISGVPYFGIVGEHTGYIALSSFTENCSEDVKIALKELKKQKITNLILDLRNNGGGIMSEAINIVGMFVPKGTTVVSTKGKMKNADGEFKTLNEPIDTTIKLAVLINNQSASASEIVSGSLQDLDRAVLVGERSFGKGLVQSTRPVGYDSYIKLTTAKYYIPSGRCIQAINYSKRGADGSLIHIPDSLINEFKTVKGRKVYDGGGIMPDAKVSEETLSVFTIGIYTQGYIEDFAKEYFKLHKEKSSMKPSEFKLSDADYKEFIKFMSDKTINYDSKTDAVLQSLKKIAAEEKQLQRIETQVNEIEKLIKSDKNNNLMLFKEELSSLIEDEIIVRAHYDEGVTEHNLMKHNAIQKALKILNSPEEYKQAITKDTTKK